MGGGAPALSDPMSTLICFGFGYCAEHFVAAFGQKFERIIGTVRGAERAAILNAYRCRALASAGVRRHASRRPN